jgi:hypothetical protein
VSVRAICLFTAPFASSYGRTGLYSRWSQRTATTKDPAVGQSSNIYHMERSSLALPPLYILDNAIASPSYAHMHRRTLERDVVVQLDLPDELRELLVPRLRGMDVIESDVAFCVVTRAVPVARVDKVALNLPKHASVQIIQPGEMESRVHLRVLRGTRPPASRSRSRPHPWAREGCSSIPVQKNTTHGGKALVRLVVIPLKGETVPQTSRIMLSDPDVPSG